MQYKIALYCYGAPFLLILFLLDSLTFDLTEMFFFALFLFAMFPVGLIGVIFNVIGLISSFKINDHQKKDFGLNNLLIGGITLILGLARIGMLVLIEG